MITLLDTSHDLKVCSDEIGSPVEQLLTPLTRFRRRNLLAHFAIDNGAFSHFDEAAFNALLEREWDFRVLCRFVAVPDVVGSARRTLECFERWYGLINQWPLALVAQDGLEDLPIPWKEISAIFIGGTTAWKKSVHAVQVIKAAQIMGKWVHVGRVNNPERWEWCEKFGVDSIDGTGISKHSHMRIAIRDRNQSNLFHSETVIGISEVSDALALCKVC